MTHKKVLRDSARAVRINNLPLTWPDGKELEAGDLEAGDMVVFDINTGRITEVERAKKPLRILVVRCAGCGKKLGRSKPVTKEQELAATMSVPLQNFHCDSGQPGCEPTESDVNFNTKEEWVDATT